MIEPEKLNYLAGMLDADGWFSVARTKRTPPASDTFASSVGVSNVSLALMDWLSANFGGRVRPIGPGHLGGKPRYEWRLRIYEMRNLLPQIQPCLVIKTRQCELVQQLINSANTKHRHTGVPDSVAELRLSIYHEIRSLNRPDR